MYYTKNHEWIDFRGTCAYIGVSNVKLIGFTSLIEVIFPDPNNYKIRGEVVAWIRYRDYKIDILMPTDGSIIQVNKIFSNKNPKKIAEHLEKSGWIITIIPANSYDRQELIPVKEYISMIKNDYPT